LFEHVRSFIHKGFVMSIAFTVGRIAGQAGAYAFEGTKLVSTQLALGTVDGYTERAAKLREARLAVMSGVEVEAPALPVRQRKVATA
jgi:hypothetical protein